MVTLQTRQCEKKPQFTPLRQVDGSVAGQASRRRLFQFTATLARYRSFCGQLRLAAALQAALQMQLDQVGRLSEPHPALSGGPLAPFLFRGNGSVPAFGKSVAAEFKFLHLDTRHHGTSITTGIQLVRTDYDAMGLSGLLYPYEILCHG